MSKNWRAIITRGRTTKEQIIKINEKPLKQQTLQPKGKLDLIFEGLERCERKIDKLKKDKGG